MLVARSIAIVAVFLLTVNRFLHPVQLRIWNYFGALDVLLMLALTLPFIATRWLGPKHLSATRLFWWICVAMTIDVLAFTLGEFAPMGSGHPSLESLVSYFMGMAKIVLVPAGLVTLAIASVKGERWPTVLLGLMCLIGETRFTATDPEHPLRWLILRA
jgi:hypothetical protein